MTITILFYYSNALQTIITCSAHALSVKNKKFSYIPEGTILKQVTKPTSKNSYICHIFSFNLPAENNMVKQKYFLGIARENDIVGDQYKEGMQ